MRYRVIVTYFRLTGRGLVPIRGPEVFWTGSSAEALRRAFPPNEDDELQSASYLGRVREVRFERQAGKEWLECADPRLPKGAKKI